MKNVLFQITLPTARKLGGPLPVEEIRDYTLELSADAGASFTPVGVLPASTLEVPVNDLPFSDQYIVRGFCSDIADRDGDPIDVPFVVADDSPPGTLTINVAFP